jgi:hypothetical protein
MFHASIAGHPDLVRSPAGLSPCQTITVAGASHDVSEQWRRYFACIEMARFSGFLARQERRCLQLLLASLLALLLPLGWSPPAPVADPPPLPGPGPRSAWVMLDGRMVLEIRAPAGAQTPEAFARRASRELTALAVNPTISPEQKEINALMRKAEIHAAARLPRSGCPGSPGAAAVAAV